MPISRPLQQVYNELPVVYATLNRGQRYTVAADCAFALVKATGARRGDNLLRNGEAVQYFQEVRCVPGDVLVATDSDCRLELQRYTDGGLAESDRPSSLPPVATTRIQGVLDALENSLPPELQPVDWWPDRFFNGDDTYLYGHSVANALDFVRVTRADRTRVLVANPFGDTAPRGMRTVWVSRTVPGLLLCAIGQASQTAAPMTIWRSTDYGSTWAAVLTLGTGAGGTINGVWLLSDRNVCEVNGVLYLGEYNVNSSRTDGGANDLLTLWKSTDRGVTWTAALRWNQGVNTVRHLHALKATPDDKILICSGDVDDECAMVLWDGVTDISNLAWGALPANIPAQHGNQRCRAVDVAFKDGYIWWMGDGTTAATDAVADMGWFRMPADLSQPPRRLDGKISAFPARSIYFVASFSSGAQCYIEEITDVPTSFFELGIWTTNEARTRIERSGVQRLQTSLAAALPPVMFQIGDVAFVSMSASALGKAQTSGTAAFTVSSTRRWCGVRPDAIHPVYWVDPVNGVDNTDTGRGYYPALPWQTLKYALESNRVAQGGRVLLPAGDFEEVITAKIALNADQTVADAANYLTIEGAGMNATKHSAGAASSQATTYLLGSEANGGYEFKDMHVSTKRAVSTQGIFDPAGMTNTQRLRFIRARVGGKDIGGLQNVITNGNLGVGGVLNIVGYDAQFVATTVGAAYLFGGDADGPVNFTGYRCVFDGGRGAFNPLSTDVIYGEDCLFTNYVVTAIRGGATGATVPTLLRPRFHSFINLPQWIDDGSRTEAAQWVGARSSSPLSPTAIFDSTSRQDGSAAPRDPRVFDYAESR